MDLYSLVLGHQGKSFTTQLLAGGADEAVASFFSGTYPNVREQAFGPDAPAAGASDIVYVTPMTGLTNVWAASVGREGRYVSVVCTRTVPYAAA